MPKKKKDPSSLTPKKQPAEVFNEALLSAPYVQALNKKLIGFDSQIEEVSKKISMLSGAVESLGGSIVKISQALSGEKAPAGPVAPVAPIGSPTLAPAAPVAESPVTQPTEVIGPTVPAEPSKADKLLGWATILAELAKQGGNSPPASATEEGMAKGLELMMKTMGGMATVMAELRKGFVDEFKTSIEVVKMMGLGGKPKKEPHLE